MIHDLLTKMPPEKFTKGEQKIVRELLANYPTAGLGTAASLASQANVSPPTVIRLVDKLGFDGFAEFQRALMDELNETMRSPLSMIENRKSLIESDDVFGRYLESVSDAMATSLPSSISMDLKRAVSLIADTKRRVCCLGGRFSHYLAAILWTHLQQLRPSARLLSDQRAALFDQLIDIDKRDVVIVYDFRRYQTDIVDFCREAKAQKATIILFTDPYKSPITKDADVVVTTPVEVISPYDTMTPALIVTEALITGLTGQLSNSSRERMTRLETLREKSRITVSK